MISVEEALDRILSRVSALGDERVALTAALHRVLAEDVDSPRDLPPWPASSMDGYALRSEDTRAAAAGAPTRLAVAGRVPAG
ncbi:MAG TPA: molybdopterin molybdenumtransferase MoeA, partial [Methylomirabilota bacterium]|nr:molybdopterin molybdenumtransferase MoeA [Methylomirabilota bacterium]